VDIGLRDVGIVNLRELREVSEEVLHLERILLGKKSVILLHTLDLPIVLEPLYELGVIELGLLFKNLLGRNERNNAVTLGRNLRVLLQIINRGSIVFAGRESLTGHLFIVVPVYENPYQTNNFSTKNYKMPEQKTAAPSIDMSDILTRLVKYALEGLAVAIAAYMLPGKVLKLSEIGMIALTALATFAILDVYAPSVGSSARSGAGFGIGANLVGFPKL
jgi:hypothetical protein